MYGETDVMRHRGGQLREQSADIRRLSDQLVGQADRIAWTGRAADAMRERARHRATALRECAQRYESAADALDRHADDVDRLKDAIAQRERKAGALLADARARQSSADEDLVLTHFTPPAPGHRDWLTVELPGL
jgi:hypothetical protein